MAMVEPGPRVERIRGAMTPEIRHHALEQGGAGPPRRERAVEAALDRNGRDQRFRCQEERVDLRRVRP